MMTAEETLAAKLAHQVGSLTPSVRHRIYLEEVVDDGFGGWRAGPHVVGWVESTPGGVKIRLVNTEAGRTARALLADDLLEVKLTGYPAVVRLEG